MKCVLLPGHSSQSPAVLKITEQRFPPPSSNGSITVDPVV